MSRDRLTDVAIPESGQFAFNRVHEAMDWLDSMYGPNTAEDYVATCEALRAELDARIANAKELDRG